MPSSSIKPGDDFFQYVNADWLAANPIPPDESRWGSFDVLRLDVEQQLKQILEDILSKESFVSGSDEQKIRDFYRSASDLEKRNKAGTAPLARIIKEITEIANFDDLMGVTGKLHRSGFGPFWSPFAEQDEKQSDVVALHFYQGGLGLPDRDYYLNDDDSSKKIRLDYVAYMGDMLARAGLEKDIAAATATIIDVETRLAKASLTRVELRDVEKMYNKFALMQFVGLAPQLPLKPYFEAIAMTPPAYVIVGQPKFFEGLSSVIAETSFDSLRAYLRWHVLNGMANYLSEDLERRNFDFYGRTFSGATEMKPLWRRALRATDAALDELLGKLYVARHFNEDAKRKIKDLVDHLVVAYRARIERLDWMSKETKIKALEKLGTVSRKLGYPDVWKDFTKLTIGTDSFAENAMRAAAFEFDRKMKEVGGPVNRNEWLMSPQTVNAYYMPPMNDIVFPAAILQPPFFDPNADLAANFGGIGSVIGHELTHGFDDQGSRFDSRGNLNEWWTQDDKVRFDVKASHLVDQFNAYEPLPGTHVNGKLTLGENIADLGGLYIAYDGLKLALAEGKAEGNVEKQKADGPTPEQKFFIAYAITERGHAREERRRLLLQVDPHSPSEFRVNGPLSNMPEFYEAFGGASGDKMWREPGDRVKIW